jgi:hypothetical protein
MAKHTTFKYDFKVVYKIVQSGITKDLHMILLPIEVKTQDFYR